MKKHFLFLLLPFAACFPFPLQAQLTPADSLAQLKPSVGGIGFGIKAEGLKGLIWENSFDSLVLQFRKVMKPALVFRLDASLAFNSSKFTEKDNHTNGGYSYTEESTKQYSIGLVPGVEKHFGGTHRLDPYVGVALPFAILGKLQETEIEDDVYEDGGFDKQTIEQTVPGGFGIGLDGMVGLNYYFADRLALGIEYSIGFSMLNIQGKATYKRIEKSKSSSNGTVETDITEFDDEIGLRNSFFGNKGVAGLNLIFYLGK